MTAMSFYDDVVVPYCIELSCGVKALAPYREKATAGLHGIVLEIGFGSGMNLPYMPKAVTRVLAVDPSERARRIGRRRIDAARCPVEFVGLEAESIRAERASADCALSTFTLCTIPDVARALEQVRRIVRPGGRLHFVEHGRAPDAGVAHWQDRLNGIQRFACGGCNLNRDIPALVRAAGFTIESLDTGYMKPAPPTHGYLFSGAARAE
jgi:ubiquinone/menaquinone biosynthesis C-methylase UbiE